MYEEPALDNRQATNQGERQEGSRESGEDTGLALWSPDGEEIRTFDKRISDSPENLPNTKIIFAEALSTVRTTSDAGHHINLSGVATPCRYRFIDCLKFVHEESLQVIEVSDLPRGAYVAISHVWASALPKPNIHVHLGSFLVECEERNDGGPISIDVLHYACLAALQEGVPFLWLDRLCILQTLGEGENVSVDKKWQIMHMHDIYQQSRVTLVLSAGLRRFPDKFESTGWVERAWTFQEAMVAPDAKVLFVDYKSVSPNNRSPPVHMLRIDEYFKMQPTGEDDHNGVLERQRPFVQALDSRNQFRSNDLVDISARYHSIWQLIQWRSSARQADVVFSVMAMLGVTLDPSRFQKHDRFGATLALVQQMLINDPRKNTCVDIPMWKKIDKAYVLDACKRHGLPPYNVHEYLMRLPSILQTIAQLENELDSQPIRGFRNMTKRSLLTALGSGWRVSEDVEKMQRQANNLAKEIPLTLMQKVYDNQDKSDHQTPFHTSQRVFIGLCKRLYPKHSVPLHQPDEFIPQIPHSATNHHIFGWSIQGVLWLQTTDPNTSRRPPTIPVPVVTFWKFSLPDDVVAV